MAGHSILFSAPMIKALLDGRKTQTRRLLPNPEFYGCPTGDCPHATQAECNAAMQETALPDVRHVPGDRLWVRETYYQPGHWKPVPGKLTKGGAQKWRFVPVEPLYSFHEPAAFRRARRRKDPSTIAWHKRLGRFMPRRYSRLTLVVTDVRVEHLQDISEADCLAEGAPLDPDHCDGTLDGSNPHMCFTDNPWVRQSPRAWYHRLWDSINGPGAWDANPWVVATTFELQRRNIDHGKD